MGWPIDQKALLIWGAFTGQNSVIQRERKNCIQQSFHQYHNKGADPEKDVTTIKVDLRLFTLKPLHAEVMTEIYDTLS